MEKLLSIDDVSKMLGVKKATIYAWTSQGKIPHIKLSKRLLKFSEKEITEWLISKKSVNRDELPHKGEVKHSKVLKSNNDYIERIIKNAKEEVLVNDNL